ncbi:curli assembly protein CsgF [Alcaligenaceae bacterium CGII-47]|nr:curli assembly protein CsgF [Alcaligenaceae bacterium CGII-47]
MNFIKNRCGSPRTKLQVLLATVAVLPLLAGPVVASQLIYTPVNPAFGGSPLNGPYLLQKAQAGKNYTMPMDDLDFLNSFGIIAQTDTAIIFKKGDKYYSYDIASGALRYIDFDNPMSTGATASVGDLGK